MVATSTVDQCMRVLAASPTYRLPINGGGMAAYLGGEREREIRKYYIKSEIHT